MDQDPINDLVDGMERMGKMTFDDLPDVVIMQIFDKLDIVSRHKMRGVNKRMNGIQLKVKNNLERIKLEFPDCYFCKLVLNESGAETVTILPRDENELVHALSRLSVNTHVKKIELGLERNSRSIQRIRVINIIFEIDADDLAISPIAMYGSLLEMNIFMLLSLVQKYTKLSIEFVCYSLVAQDLCIIRKMMIEGNCKLESFKIQTNYDVRSAFIQECFEIVLGKAYRRNNEYMTFRASDESVEIYIDKSHSIVCHFEGNFKTTIHLYTRNVSFEKCKDDSKPNDSYEKVKWNHGYVTNFEDSDDD